MCRGLGPAGNYTPCSRSLISPFPPQGDGKENQKKKVKTVDWDNESLKEQHREKDQQL